MELKQIVFNRPYLTGKEIENIQTAADLGKISGDGKFTKQCHSFMERKWHFSKILLTTSCTDALEMAAMLMDIQPGDEVIMPSYTFVSTANAFVLRGAKLVFADSLPDEPNINTATLEALITPRTRAIVPVHYAGVACEMDTILKLAKKNGLFVVEDAAQAIDSTYQGKMLGGIGDLGAFSFHETKNIQCGEGGCIAINNPSFVKRAEVLREKGTNRSAFFRGEVDKYNWVDVGSSFLPSEILAAFLYAQLEQVDNIQAKRKKIWNDYNTAFSVLKGKGFCRLPHIPDYASNNAHMFYLVCNSSDDRAGLINHLKSAGVHAVFHYLSLHKSPYYSDKHDGRELPWADSYSERLVRLPLWAAMEEDDIQRVIKTVLNYFK
jgi:dTDP-4-amino-4,6-dideoxygalactose transaminase